MKVIPIPCLNDNFAYLLICAETNEAAVVDPSEYKPVFKEVQKRKVTLTTIFNTHHHWDHVGGNDELSRHFPGIKIHAHISDRDRVPGQTDFLEDGDFVQFGNQKGSILHNPGHTSGAITYLFGNMAFTGDTLFSGGCGRVFEGTMEQMHHSMNEKIGKLPDDTQLYFGHEYTENNLRFAQTLEPKNEDIQSQLTQIRKLRSEGKWSTPSLLGSERKINPFLRCHDQALQKHVIQKQPDTNLDPVSIFTVIRKLKDQF